jgi:hypothetical protein
MTISEGHKRGRDADFAEQNRHPFLFLSPFFPQKNACHPEASARDLLIFLTQLVKGFFGR